MTEIKTLRQQDFARLLEVEAHGMCAVRLARHMRRAWPPPWQLDDPAYSIHDYWVPIASDSLEVGRAIAVALGLPPAIIVAGFVPRQGQSAAATWTNHQGLIQLDERLGPEWYSVGLLDPIKHLSYESSDRQLYEAAPEFVDSQVDRAIDLMLELAGELKPGQWADCFTSSPLVPAFGRQMARDIEVDVLNDGWIKDKLSPADSFVVLLRESHVEDVFYMPAG